MGLLAYPVPGPYQGAISQRFGARPNYYRKFGLPGHEGVDWAVPVGTPVLAAAEGRVILALADNGKHPYGTHIRIRHDNGLETIYAHLSRLMVKRNDEVKRGETIGLSGNSGNSTGPHLHFSVKQDEATARGLTPHYIDPITGDDKVWPRNIMDPLTLF